MCSRGSTNLSHDVAIQTAINILDGWGCPERQQQKILGMSDSAYQRYRQHSDAADLSDNQLERVSYLLNIHAALRTLFSNPENVYGFMAMSNNNPFFDGRSPLEVLNGGDYSVLSEVARRITTLSPMDISDK